MQEAIEYRGLYLCQAKGERVLWILAAVAWISDQKNQLLWTESAPPYGDSKKLKIKVDLAVTFGKGALCKQ